jgi:hypothetical protein
MIVKGYKGIIDLDLTNIHPVLHKSLIDQHKMDIEKYKLYQQTLEPKLRYENTIELIFKKRAFYNKKRNLKHTTTYWHDYDGVFADDTASFRPFL